VLTQLFIYKTLTKGRNKMAIVLVVLAAICYYDVV